jgi:hypothetical protein
MSLCASMSFQLESILSHGIKEFNQKCISEITPKIHHAKGKNKPVHANQPQIKNALRKICPLGRSKSVAKYVLLHFDELEKIIPFCSSPKSLSPHNCK